MFTEPLADQKWAQVLFDLEIPRNGHKFFSTLKFQKGADLISTFEDVSYKKNTTFFQGFHVVVC